MKFYLQKQEGAQIWLIVVGISLTIDQRAQNIIFLNHSHLK
jgi:hypothetical protein